MILHHMQLLLCTKAWPESMVEHMLGMQKEVRLLETGFADKGNHYFGVSFLVFFGVLIFILR